MKIARISAREQEPSVRATNFDEVCYGFDLDQATAEAGRCLQCKKPRCVEACPVSVQIPVFISRLVNGDLQGAGAVIARDNLLPSVCGRVCPQESQCEGSCILGVKGEPVSIGALERFVGDSKFKGTSDKGQVTEQGDSNFKGTSDEGQVTEGQVTEQGDSKFKGTRDKGQGTRDGAEPFNIQHSTFKIAVVGSGPSGLACAADLAKMGYAVTIFEVLHKPGGVLQYGIPEFRLPKSIVEREIDKIRALGVVVECDTVVGRTVTIDGLFEAGFKAVFVGSGAGLPKFMGIEGENLSGVVSANEFLTRANLMHAYDSSYDTPIFTGAHTVVVGGGNVAMDAVRTAKRLGAKATIVYRRSVAELPARGEEVHHAMQEGINFEMLTNPLAILSDDKGWVRAIKLQRMELGQPDASGRRSPVPIDGSEFEIECSSVIMALGTSPNPLIAQTTTGLEVNRHGCIVTFSDDGTTSRNGVFAGGDAVTGAATVILAMGAGRKAAAAIDKYVQQV